MVEGGGSCTGGGGGSGTAVGLCLAARPEEDEGGWGPAIRERRGALGRWAEEWGGGLAASARR
jgi:hypothetical protein